ncbi:MAG: efflux RND transporter periplasmic adaptor subunit [Desulfobulbaceae bacterium]|nr:efflux RND transporter periplasmic adaptor subunit [Desulfobulbaceae bacterium]
MKSRICSLALVLLAITLLTGCSGEEKDAKKKQQAQEIPPLSVEFITVQNEKIPIWIEYTGKTEATKRVEVRARVAGRLEKALFTEGDLVEKGQKLFEIEKTAYLAALDQTKAKMQRDQASLDLAKADVKRYVPLVEKGLAPRATLEQYEARKNELMATIKADMAAIKEAELNLSYTEVVAPISGRISRRYVDVGNIVGYGDKTLLTTIIDDDPMYAYFNPAEQDFQLMSQFKSKDRMEARVRIPTAMKGMLKREIYKGWIDFTDNRVDRLTGTITMRATVDNPNYSLLEGTFVYVEVFVTDQQQFIMVPPSVVFEDQRGSFVYTLGAENKSVRTDVIRGFEGRNYLQIANGLAGGEKVIVSALPNLAPGIKVDPKDVTGSKGIMAVLKQQEMIPTEE